MRIKRRWTLGGLMLLIAVLSVPLAFYVRHLREIERQNAELRAMLEIRRQEYERFLIQVYKEAQKAQDNLVARTQKYEQLLKAREETRKAEAEGRATAPGGGEQAK